MGAFITNFQAPTEMLDLEDRFQRGGISNINMILSREQFPIPEWTVDKNAVVGDTVFFLCARTSIDHIRHLCVQLRKAGQESSALGLFAAQQRDLYQKYAGFLVAIGRVAQEPFQTEVSGWEDPHWRSPWYAKIDHIRLLNTPIHISQFRDFITVSRTGAITKLTDAQLQALSRMIADGKSCL